MSDGTQTRFEDTQLQNPASQRMIVELLSTQTFFFCLFPAIYVIFYYKLLTEENNFVIKSTFFLCYAHIGTHCTFCVAAMQSWKKVLSLPLHRGLNAVSKCGLQSCTIKIYAKCTMHGEMMVHFLCVSFPCLFIHNIHQWCVPQV